MLRIIIPIFFLIGAGALFFVFIDPTRVQIGELSKEEALYSQALNNSNELVKVRDKLLATYNSFVASDLVRLEKLIPNTVDNVKLIRDIDGIAFRYGMTVKNVTIERAPETVQKNIGTPGESFGAMLVSFSVGGPYKIFLDFLKDLERSLRLVNVVNVSFTSAEKDIYEYRVIIKTYWLK